MRISDWSSDVCSSDLRRQIPKPRNLYCCHFSAQRYMLMCRRCRPVAADSSHTAYLVVQLAIKLLEQARLPRASLRHRSEEHTSELQSLMRISYAVFCLKKKHI